MQQVTVIWRWYDMLVEKGLVYPYLFPGLPYTMSVTGIVIYYIEADGLLLIIVTINSIAQGFLDI